MFYEPIRQRRAKAASDDVCWAVVWSSPPWTGTASVCSGSKLAAMDLIAEAAQMPDAAIEFVRRNVGYVRTPDHLIPLRDVVREHHRSKLNAVFGALHQRFNQPNAPWFPAFQAAAEMAVMAEVGGAGLPPGDRQTLRKLWENLLRAR